jgi:hypothetical protein
VAIIPLPRATTCSRPTLPAPKFFQVDLDFSMKIQGRLANQRAFRDWSQLRQRLRGGQAHQRINLKLVSFPMCHNKFLCGALEFYCGIPTPSRSCYASHPGPASTGSISANQMVTVFDRETYQSGINVEAVWPSYPRLREWTSVSVWQICNLSPGLCQVHLQTNLLMKFNRNSRCSSSPSE